jgi:hypothetical protein
LNVFVSGERGVLSTTRVLVPIALDGEELLPDAVVPDELHATAARSTADVAARPARALGLMDL